MKLLCHSLSGTRYGRRFCFINFKPKSSRRSNPKSLMGSNSRSSLDVYGKAKPRDCKKLKGKKKQTNQARFSAITHANHYNYARLSQYDRMSSSSSSSVLSTDSLSSDSDSEDLSPPSHRERPGYRRSPRQARPDDPHLVITSTDESNSDFTETDISSILSVWSSSDSSSATEGEREYEFYSDPESNRLSTDSANMPVFTDLINSLEQQLSELVPISIQVLSESLLRNFSEEIGWGPCPSCVVDMLSRRTLDETDLAESPACAICCADFKAQEKVIDLPCKHYYHSECICSWLKIRSTCPACRSNVCSLLDLPETEV